MASCKGPILYGGPQLLQQNQKPHGKNTEIPHGKTKNLTAKPNISQQKQKSFGFAVGICFCRYLVVEIVSVYDNIN